MITGNSPSDQMRELKSPAGSHRCFTLARFATGALVIFALGLFIYGLAWNYSTRRYLRGFADAIIPLDDTAEKKTEALLRWFRDEPQRLDTAVEGAGQLRDPVTIVQNKQLLKVCGSASNAFINLADAAGLKTRRLLLIAESGTVMHVVAEVQWDRRWVAVDPQQGRVFRDHLGRALSKEELRDPAVFQDAIRGMPRYNPEYTFAHTHHIHLQRIPLGNLLRSALTHFFPGWEAAVNWAYILENPSLWPIVISIPLFFLGSILNWLVGCYGRKKLGIGTPGLGPQLLRAGRALLHGWA
jgi:hypothetical protein